MATGGGRVIDDPYYQPKWPSLTVRTQEPDIPNNPHGDADGDGYTNLEEWLHELAAEVEGRIDNHAGTSPSAPTGLRIQE